MEDLVFFYPEGQEAHYLEGHPESPERLFVILQALKQSGWWEAYPHLPPLEPPRSVLGQVHDREYLGYLRKACQHHYPLDEDTYTTPESYGLALQAAGGSMAVAQAVWSGAARRGYALPRPPGHHAAHSAGMGFCLLNNVALAAEFLIQERGARRLAIVDLDLHHGNGTQDIFWQREDVFFISVHQSPLYPGTGSLDETGAGAGHRKTANFPLPPGSGDQAYRAVMGELILPLLDGYQPQMILVSLGFDAHWMDPLGHLRLSAGVYGELAAGLAEWSDRWCEGRLMLLQEGGYVPETLAAGAQGCTAALLGQPWNDPIGPSPRPEGISWRPVVQAARQFWNLNSQELDEIPSTG